MTALKKNLLLVVLIGLICPGLLFAGDTISSTTTPVYGVNGNIDVTNVIEYSGKISAMAIKISLPENAEFVSASCDVSPAIAPRKGDTGLLEFAWITTPKSPFAFTYSVATFDNAAGEIFTEINYRRDSGPLYHSLTPVPVSK